MEESSTPTGCPYSPLRGGSSRIESTTLGWAPGLDRHVHNPGTPRSPRSIKQDYVKAQHVSLLDPLQRERAHATVFTTGLGFRFLTEYAHKSGTPRFVLPNMHRTPDFYSRGLTSSCGWVGFNQTRSSAQHPMLDTTRLYQPCIFCRQISNRPATEQQLALLLLPQVSAEMLQSQIPEDRYPSHVMQSFRVNQ